MTHMQDFRQFILKVWILFAELSLYAQQNTVLNGGENIFSILGHSVPHIGWLCSLCITTVWFIMFFQIVDKWLVWLLNPLCCIFLVTKKNALMFLSKVLVIVKVCSVSHLMWCLYIQSGYSFIYALNNIPHISFKKFSRF